MIFEEFTNAVDQIARDYLRQQATDPTARERWHAAQALPISLESLGGYARSQACRG